MSLEWGLGRNQPHFPSYIHPGTGAATYPPSSFYSRTLKLKGGFDWQFLHKKNSVFSHEPVHIEQIGEGTKYLEPATTSLGAGPYYADTTVNGGDPPGRVYVWVASTTYPDFFYLLLVGAEHDGTDITTPGTEVYLRYYPAGAGTPVPSARPFYTKFNVADPRFDALADVSKFQEVASLGLTYDTARLFKSLFHEWTSAEYGSNIQGVPAVGDGEVVFESMPLFTFAFDADRFTQNPVFAQNGGRVFRLGGDCVRYRQNSVSVSADEHTQNTVSPLIQQRTHDAIDNGDDSIHWMPYFEVPKNTPFDVLISVQKITRSTFDYSTLIATEDDGYLLTPYLYYNYLEPLAWYSTYP